MRPIIVIEKQPKNDEYLDKYLTISKSGESITPNTIIYTYGTGKLDELVIKSRNDFNIVIYVDGTIIHDKRFSKIKEVSEIIDEISAIENENYNILNIRNISFSESIVVKVEGEGFKIEYYYKLTKKVKEKI